MVRHILSPLARIAKRLLLEAGARQVVELAQQGKRFLDELGAVANLACRNVLIDRCLGKRRRLEAVRLFLQSAEGADRVGMFRMLGPKSRSALEDAADHATRLVGGEGSSL